MLVLGIETSTRQGGVAIIGAERVVCETVLNVEATHSERLLPAVDRALDEAGMTLEGLGGIAVSIGPGSFTGLRIGLSTAKGLAYATGLPLVGVPTLEAMAWTLPAARWQVCPVLDARKQEVYAALFRHEPEGLRRMMDDTAMAPEDLCRLIRNPTLFLGDGVDAYAALFRERLGERMLLPPLASRGARPASVAELGRRRLLRGERDGPDSLVPRYLRPSEAELRRRRESGH
ncbi:MAG: Peptidase glycoprotease [candidate division NC10 bacterium]|jgi:tRNA threonylcarbamoyladenosine biosynthesis protein TsaB|nr:Peptidase glycoprotease [candidate division NC10 bacterium]